MATPRAGRAELRTNQIRRDIRETPLQARRKTNSKLTKDNSATREGSPAGLGPTGPNQTHKVQPLSQCL